MQRIKVASAKCQAPPTTTYLTTSCSANSIYRRLHDLTSKGERCEGGRLEEVLRIKGCGIFFFVYLMYESAISCTKDAICASD